MKILYLLLITLISLSVEAKVNLLYWVSTNPEEMVIGKTLVKLWNKLNPDVKVKVQPIPAGSSSEEVLLAAIVAKTMPDICSNMNPAAMGRFIKAKAFVKLDQFNDFFKVMDARSGREILKQFQSDDGHYYQVPWKSNPVMLAYNKDIFQEFNLKPPVTYDDFFKIAKKVTLDTDGDSKIDRWAMSPSTQVLWWQRLFDFYPFYLAASSGKSLLTNNYASFNNDSAYQAMGFFAEGFKKGYFPRANLGRDLFLDQKTVMTVVGPWAIKHFQKMQSVKFDYGFVPLPVPKKSSNVYTYGDMKNISIFSTTKYPKEAWQFVKFLISKKADLLLLQKAFQIPLRKNMANNKDFAAVIDDNPKLLPFVKQARSVKSIDDSIHLVQILDYLGQQYEASAVYGVLKPRDAIKKAAQYVDVIYKYW